MAIVTAVVGALVTVTEPIAAEPAASDGNDDTATEPLTVDGVD